MPGPRMNNDIENVGLCGTKMRSNMVHKPLAPLSKWVHILDE
jgi:hypothetical protein